MKRSLLALLLTLLLTPPMIRAESDATSAGRFMGHRDRLRIARAQLSQGRDEGTTEPLRPGHRRHDRVVGSFAAYLQGEKDGLPQGPDAVERAFESVKANENTSCALIWTRGMGGTDGWCYSREFSDRCEFFRAYLIQNGQAECRTLLDRLSFGRFNTIDNGAPSKDRMMKAVSKCKGRCEALLEAIRSYCRDIPPRSGSLHDQDRNEVLLGTPYEAREEGEPDMGNLNLVGDIHVE